MTILTFIEDPGAANYLLPVIDTLRARGLTVELRTAGAAKAYVRDRTGTDPREASGSAVHIIETARPELILVGTSENPKTFGFDLIDTARARRIPSVGTVDSPANVDARFRGCSTRPLAHAPDVIIAPDAATAATFVRLGQPADGVRVCGHPHYDTVRARGAMMAAEGRATIRARVLMHDPGKRMVLLFASEVSTGLNQAQYRRSSAYTLHGSGRYDLRTEIVLEEFLDVITRITPRPYLVLRLHPKNTRQELAPFLDAFDQISEGGAALDIVFSADAVVGMTSMLLFEAALLAKPTLAILPRPEERMWLSGIETGLIATATTTSEIQAQLQRLLARSTAPVTLLPPENAAARAADVITGLLT